MSPTSRDPGPAELDDVDIDVMAMDYDDLPEASTGALAWGRRHAHEHRAVWPGVVPPPRNASFGDKLAFYRSRHSSVGVRAAHLAGVPAAAAAIPLLLVRPKAGLACLAAAGALEYSGHALFQQDTPHPAEDLPETPLCALAFWGEEVRDLLGRARS